MTDHIKDNWGYKKRAAGTVQTLQTAVEHGYQLRALDVPGGYSATLMQKSNAAWAESLRAVPQDTQVVVWGGSAHNDLEYGATARDDKRRYTRIDFVNGPAGVYINRRDPNDSDVVVNTGP